MKVLRWLASLPWSWFIAASALLSTYLIWRSKKNTVSTWQEAVEVQEQRERIRADEAELAKLMLAADQDAGHIAALKQDMRAAQERVAWLASPAGFTELKGMTDDELSAELTRLGF